MKKVELLAPAGNYESFLGAVHAGADAVYLGGEKFGARAYADNFTEEEVCRAIRYAHIYGRKVYLTVNTLVKEREFHDLYSYLLPFYEAGLDGVIIQDLGVFQAVGKWFPALARHASTQMAVTGFRGAEYLKDLGAKRIVPARELSLAEIKEMKKKADIEIETFIHGAICYCYSGQCLFSSVIGGRSGNRGRCAQPCRLPYRISSGFSDDMPGREARLRQKTGKDRYPLSLKDMCTVELLGELIEAGIDSFKIEGRMKSPEYAAGVTGIYRKYIDKYYEDPKNYCVEEEDRKKLESLYIRSEISQGYYYKHNGKDMVSLENPGYTGSDEILLGQIRRTYLEGDFRYPVQMRIKLVKGEETELAVIGGGVNITVKGEKPQEAQKQPLTKEGIRRQLGKCGKTAFYLDGLHISMPGDIFLPVKSINDLRRMALECLEEEIIRKNGFPSPYERKTERLKDEEELHKKDSKHLISSEKKGRKTRIHAFALTKEQCSAAVSCGVERLYVDADLCMDGEWMEKWKDAGEKTAFYLALPYVLRQRDDFYLNRIEALLGESVFEGVLMRNLEELQYMKDRFRKDSAIKIVSDAGLYIWNKEALRVLGKDCGEAYVPLELNIHELKELTDKEGERELAMSVYGRIPMMVSANCVAGTMEGCCRKKKGKKGQSLKFAALTDRYGKAFPIYLNCIHCYNVIYNSLPLSLHQNADRIKEAGISTFRLDFTTEGENETKKILRFWMEGEGRLYKDVPYEEYTKGHFKRGAE